MKADEKPEAGGPSLSVRLTYLLIGGGIGAIIALLFAPKPGTEVRSDIADATRPRIGRLREPTESLRPRVGEYSRSARDYERHDTTAGGGHAGVSPIRPIDPPEVGGGHAGVTPIRPIDPPDATGALAGDEDFPETGE